MTNNSTTTGRLAARLVTNTTDPDLTESLLSRCQPDWILAGKLNTSLPAPARKIRKMPWVAAVTVTASHTDPDTLAEILNTDTRNTVQRAAVTNPHTATLTVENFWPKALASKSSALINDTAARLGSATLCQNWDAVADQQEKVVGIVTRHAARNLTTTDDALAVAATRNLKLITAVYAHHQHDPAAAANLTSCLSHQEAQLVHGLAIWHHATPHPRTIAAALDTGSLPASLLLGYLRAPGSYNVKVKQLDVTLGQWLAAWEWTPAVIDAFMDLRPGPDDVVKAMSPPPPNNTTFDPDTFCHLVERINAENSSLPSGNHKWDFLPSFLTRFLDRMDTATFARLCELSRQFPPTAESSVVSAVISDPRFADAAVDVSDSDLVWLYTVVGLQVIRRVATGTFFAPRPSYQLAEWVNLPNDTTRPAESNVRKMVLTNSFDWSVKRGNTVDPAFIDELLDALGEQLLTSVIGYPVLAERVTRRAEEELGSNVEAWEVMMSLMSNGGPASFTDILAATKKLIGS